MEHIISFGSDGKVASMYSDGFQLNFLGQQRIVRASDIKWGADLAGTESWSIYLVIGKAEHTNEFLGGFTTYEAARAFEVELLNRCRAAQIDPLSDEGKAIAKELRA